VEGIDDFKVLGHDLEMHLKAVQEMVLDLALKTDQNIEFYVEYINSLIESKLISKAERALRISLNKAKDESAFDYGE